MLIQRTDVTGLDVMIQAYQSKLHTNICAEWGLDVNSATDWLCYDRCYRNQYKTGFVPEIYSGNGNYKEVLLDDKTKVLSFFGIGDTLTQELDEISVNVHLLFFVNLEKVFAQRKDELARQDVMKFATSEYYGFKFDSVNIGIDRVLPEYNGSELRLKYKDLQPFHIFRLNFNLKYNVNKHIC